MSNTQGPHQLAVHRDWLRVPLGDGDHADFHHRWLRHNCDDERHPRTGERTRCSSELPDDLAPRTAQLLPDHLELTWPDGHVSTYPIAWLRTHAYALNRVDVPAPTSALAPLELLPADRTFEERAAEALALVRRHGAAVVRNDDSGPPEDTTAQLLLAFLARGLRVIDTHFGHIEDLRTDNTTNANTDQLGYTDSPIGLHTDQPFLEHPPRYQLLQCVRPADVGGDNLLADARTAFRHLEVHDARAADLLATVPVRFHRKQKNFERILDTPLVARRGDDDFLIRSSYFTLAPHRLPFAGTTEFYRAHDRLTRLLRDPSHHVHVRLERGDWLIYDNHRTLHARTGFTGPRWLKGIYFDE